MDITEINDPLDIARHCGDPTWRPVLCVEWEHGTVNIETQHESQNGTSFHEWHGHSSSWDIPLVNAEQVRDAIEECLPSIRAASEQYYSDWDGNNNVAKFRDEEEEEEEARDSGGSPMDAGCEFHGARAAAIAKIEQAMDGLEHAGSAWFWDAGDWFGAVSTTDMALELGITALTTDAELDDVAASMVEVESDTGEHNVILDLADCRTYAEQIRDELLEDEDVLADLWGSLPGPVLARVDDAGDTIEAKCASDAMVPDAGDKCSTWLTLDTSNDAVEVAYDCGNGVDGETDWTLSRLGPYSRAFQGASLPRDQPK